MNYWGMYNFLMCHILKLYITFTLYFTKTSCHINIYLNYWQIWRAGYYVIGSIYEGHRIEYIHTEVVDNLKEKTVWILSPSEMSFKRGVSLLFCGSCSHLSWFSRLHGKPVSCSKFIKSYYSFTLLRHLQKNKVK